MQKGRSQKSQKQQQKMQKQKQQRKIHRGIFIAEQRRKGKGGRIKSNSLSNKIEVKMKRDVSYLHQTEVQWIQVGRFNKKQGRRKKKEQKMKKTYKQKKFEQKKQNKQKYVQKQNGKPKQVQQKNNEKNNQQINNEKEKQPQISQKQPETQAEGLNDRANTKIQSSKSQNQNKQVQQEGERGQQSSQSSDENDDVQLNNNKGDQNFQQQKIESAKKEEDDIVIIAQIVKQLQNPFWKKPFVGILKFIQKQSHKKENNKYKEKAMNQKSHISRIMDDFDIDFQPIHMRLPVCFVEKNNGSEKLLQDYMQKNIKYDKNEKGGKIRNRILDQLQSMYALVSFIQIDGKNVYVNLTKIIGKAKTIQGQCNCFLYQNELNDFEHDYSKQEKIQQMKLNTTPNHKKFDQMVFTIDPLTSTDLDDALSVRKIQENLYEFGIHISDVSSYLDKIPREQILKRTTSVYLPHYVLHMLPSNLVTIASLNPNVQRLAFSVFVQMNENGQVLNSKLQKNLLKSRFKLAYEHAQSIIQNTMSYESFNNLHNCSQQEYKLLVQKIKIIQKVGLAHRRKRLVFQIFDNDQIKFQLDEQKWPISFSVKSRNTAQKLIQQFMIIGNIHAAQKSIEFDPKNSLVIHHPRPSDLAIKQFNQNFQILNYKFEFKDSLSLQKDLLKVSMMQNISQQIKKLCYFKARRAQETANYKRYSDIQNLKGNIHFALGLRYYTHFTSPMRRIADIIVHQVLNPVVDSNVHKKQLLQQEIAQANWGRKNTKRLKRNLSQMYLCLMIYKTKKQVQAEGIVASFGCKSVSIYVPLFDMNKQIIWRDMRVDKVFKNKQDEKKVDVVIHYDKKSAKKDIIWVLQKFQKISIKIGCSTQIPLRLTFQFQVETNKGKQKVKPKPYI